MIIQRMCNIKTEDDFNHQFVTVFGYIDKVTLSGHHSNRLRINLGSNGDNSKIKKELTELAIEILRYCFANHEVWLRIILWGESEEKNLKEAGFDINKALKAFRSTSEENEVLFINFKELAESLITPVVTSIINYDMAVTPSANITCYFISFSCTTIVNIYDDRGLDIYCLDPQQLNKIKLRFENKVNMF
jgi:hypothetical protein